jgi:ABC-type multidrug transport system ATPase subunit
LGHPDVVLLDEPTTGLDPESRRDGWQVVRGLGDEGTTVLLTTHYLEEAEALADRLEIMHAGRIVSGTPGKIAARASLSPGTVRNYLSNAMTKLGAANRHDACAIARRMGWT